MDYTTQPLPFRLRKAIRYTRLYGPSRTLVKVRSQYHMKRRFRVLPQPRPPRDSRRHVGIIGCGKFAYANIAYYLTKNHGQVIRAAMDIEPSRAASLFERYGLDYYADTADDLLDDPAIDLIFVASNHASHAEYAIEALRRGKHVHIEKPHVVTGHQLERLCAAMRDTSANVTLGFNRPQSRIGREIKRHLDSQSGPGVYNWFVAGHEIPRDHWYFSDQEGGRVLGNLCHWTDFIYRLVPAERRHPIEIRPTSAGTSDANIAVTFAFGDGTIAAITFSAKGHTFEGVKERFAAHRGDALLTMDDFRSLTVDIVERRYRVRTLFRDHGHEANICRSYELARPSAGKTAHGESPTYVWETGELFLKAKEALELGRTVTVEPYQP